MPLPLSLAKEFFAKPGQKFRFAKKEELPFIPDEKVYPHDPGKKPEAQIRATTTKTSTELKKEYEEGVVEKKSALSWSEVRSLAKENDIVAYKRSKADLEEELKAKNII
jgi:hypothetical protein